MAQPEIPKKALADLSIKQKLWIGLGLVLFLLVGQAVNIVYSQKNLRDAVQTSAQELEPILFEVLKLETLIGETTAALGFYLTGKEASHKASFDRGLDELGKHFERFLARPAIQANQTLADDIQNIREKIDVLSNYRDYIVRIAENDVINVPAMAFSQDTLQPINQRIRGQITLLLQAETNEEPSLARREILLTLSNLQYYWVNVSASVRTYLAFRNPEALAELEIYRNLTQDAVSWLTDRADDLTLDQLDTLPELQNSLDEFAVTSATLVEIHSGRKWRKDTHLVREKIGPLLSAIQVDLAALVEHVTQQFRENSEGMLHDIQRNMILTVVLVTAGIGLAVLVLLGLSRFITGPLNEAVFAMTDIAEGEGNLSRRLDDSGNDEIARLADGFNKFVVKIKSVVDLVIASSTSLSSEAGRMTTVTSQSRDNVMRQQGEINKIATAIGELTESVEQVAGNAVRAAEAAAQARSEAENGREVVTKAVGSIGELSDVVDNTVTVIQTVEQESASIGEVLSVIRGISEQTNLLALNAAIEAARAGENGRGFAVVADEVRNLSQRTQQQTVEIEQRIAKLQAATGKVSRTMLESQEATHMTVGLARQAGEALEAITGAVATITTLNASIAETTEMQARSAEAMHSNVITVNGLADETAQAAVQASASSNEFSIMAGQLQGLVEQFLLEPASGKQASQRQAATDAGQAEGAGDEDDVTLF